MAYQTGSVLNTYELFDTFRGWMTGSGGPGWLEQAAPSWSSTGTGSTDVRDMVFWSSGSTSNKSLTYRATFLNPTNMDPAINSPGLTSSIGTKKTTEVHNQFDYIIFRGYQNWAFESTLQEAGTGSFGVMGPCLYHMPRRGDFVYAPSPISVLNFSSSNPDYHPIESADNSFFNWQKTGNSAWGSCQSMWGYYDNPNVFYQAAGEFDGRRIMIYVVNDRQDITSNDNWDNINANYLTIGAYDMANGSNQPLKYDASSKGPYLSANEGYEQNGFCIVYDKETHGEYVYYVAYNETYFWRRVNLKTGAMELLDNIPFGNISHRGWFFVWDGDDYIYCLATYSTNYFQRYSISGDSWASMASLPVGTWDSANYNSRDPLLYVPHSASTVTLTSSLGNPTDCIYGTWRGSNNGFYRYDVSNDNWQSQTVFPANWQDGHDKVWWDGQDKVWWSDYSDNRLYSKDITGVTADYNTWVKTTEDINQPYGGATNRQKVLVSNPISKIRGQQQSFYETNASKMNYWFQGDQDAINIITETSGAFYWAHFGTYDSLIQTNTMKASAGFSAGSIVTVGVDSTSGFTTGQEVIFADVSGSATVEKNQILEIVNSTSFKVSNLTNNFNSGTLIGTDPHQAVVTGDSFLAVASLDGGGYRSNDMASAYRVMPTTPFQLMRMTNTDAQGFYTPWPLLIYNNIPTLDTYQAKGMLKNCWVMNLGSTESYPSLVSGDSLNIAGTSYRVFPLEETTTLMGNGIDRLLLLIKTE